MIRGPIAPAIIQDLGRGGVRGPVVVTGTDTGVGKTIATAAIAAAATGAGLSVAVVKPGQTGIREGSDERSDVEIVARLAAPATATTLATYPDPLAPAVAARLAGLPPLDLPGVVAAISGFVASHDLVLIEGAGGLLVPMGIDDWTIADLAVEMGAKVVVVTRAGLGTLNHTALTLEALGRRYLTRHIVIGSWPAEPAVVHRSNLADLAALSGGLAGVLPEGAAALSPHTFRVSSPSWLAPPLHGQLKPDATKPEATAIGA